MGPNTMLFLRIAISAFQLLCILPLLFAMSQANPLIAAVQAAWSGNASISEVCWKILPVSGPLFLAMFGFLCLAALKQTIKQAPQDASQPWLANPMWVEKHIRLNNRGQFWSVVSVLAFYVGIVVPFCVGTQKTAFLIFCAAFGLVLLLIARVFWLNRRWNTAELRMATLPGVIGGPFSGVAILQQAFPAGTAFDVCLKCEVSQSVRKKGWSSTGERTRGSETISQTVWSSTLSIDKLLPADSPNRTLVPFGFAIPIDCEPTSAWQSSTRKLTAWYLVVKERNKVGFGGAVFTVPVFVTPASSPDYVLDQEFLKPFEVAVDVEAVLARAGLTQEVVAGGGQRLALEKWDSSAAFSMATTSLFCIALVVAFLWTVRPLMGAVFAALFPGALLVTVLYSLLDMLLWKSTVQVDRNSMRCQSGWRGFQKSLTFAEEERPVFSAKLDRLKENGEWYRVDVCKRTTNSEFNEEFFDAIPLVRRLDGRAEAEAVANWFDQHCQTAALGATV